MNEPKDRFLVLCSLFVVRRSSLLVLCSSLMAACAFAADKAPGTKNQERAAEVYRPVAGKFPLLEQAKAYDGQLAFVDHANRRGSLRVTGGELMHRTPPVPFALLPYGMVRYHGAPADLRNVPLGTMLHGLFYLPPDPKLSSVPVVTQRDPARREPCAPAGRRTQLLPPRG